MDILGYIRELIILNECVIIPNFGGFIANYKHAKVSGAQFTPPTNLIVFNTKLNFNDGLLITHVSAEENIGYQQAKKRVDSLVLELNYRLTKGEDIEVPGIGSLRYDSQHRLQFTSFDHLNLNADAYGLSAFTYKSILSDRLSTTIGTKRRNAEPIALSTKKAPWYKKRAIWVAPVLLALLAIPLKNQLSKNIQESNILDFSTQKTEQVAEQAKPSTVEEATYAPTTELEQNAESNDLTAEASTVEELTSPEVNATNEPTAPAEAEMAVKVETLKYFVIAGSFRSEDNAHRLGEMLDDNGFESAQLGVIKGLHYVAAGSYTELDQAQKALASIKSGNALDLKGCWIYKAKL